jgi:hypothetical protein
MAAKFNLYWQVMALLFGYDAPFCFVEAIGAMLAAIFAAIAALEQVFGGENDEPFF